MRIRLKAVSAVLALVVGLVATCGLAGCYGAIREVHIRGVEVGLLKNAPRDETSPAAKEQLLADQRLLAAKGSAEAAVLALIETGVPSQEAKRRILAAFAAQVGAAQGGVK
jgi:hypothetical protein